MKRFFLSYAFFLLTTLTVFAQTPEQKAAFLTNEMDALLSLSIEQQEKVNQINIRRFTVEAKGKEYLENNARYQNAKSENFQTEAGQQMQAELNNRIEKGENRYDGAMQKVLDSSQYNLYLQNKNNLLQAVVIEFGE